MGALRVDRPEMASPMGKVKLGQVVRKKKKEAKKERREVDRRVVHSRYDVSVTLVPDASENNQSDPISGVVTDVSVAGLGLCVAKRIHLNSMVLVEINTDRFSGTLRARVVWCSEMPTGGKVLSAVPRRWRIGIHFLPQTDEQEALESKLFQEL